MDSTTKTKAQRVVATYTGLATAGITNELLFKITDIMMLAHFKTTEDMTIVRDFRTACADELICIEQRR